MENPTKMDDLGVPPFMETSICLCCGLVSLSHSLSLARSLSLSLFLQQSLGIHQLGIPSKLTSLQISCQYDQSDSSHE